MAWRPSPLPLPLGTLAAARLARCGVGMASAGDTCLRRERRRMDDAASIDSRLRGLLQTQTPALRRMRPLSPRRGYADVIAGVRGDGHRLAAGGNRGGRRSVAAGDACLTCEHSTWPWRWRACRHAGGSALTVAGGRMSTQAAATLLSTPLSAQRSANAAGAGGAGWRIRRRPGKIRKKAYGRRQTGGLSAGGTSGRGTIRLRIAPSFCLTPCTRGLVATASCGSALLACCSQAAASAHDGRLTNWATTSCVREQFIILHMPSSFSAAISYTRNCLFL